jgi:proteic killer suppression protein
MEIQNFIHKGPKKLYFEDSAKGIPSNAANKLRKMLAFLEAMDDPEELQMLPSWNAHPLKGERKGTWSLSVTANWRLTFRFNAEERAICDVNFEDYH